MAPSILQEWLGELPCRTFQRRYFGALPFARPHGALGSIEACRWQELDALLSEWSALDLLVVARGQLVDAPAPRCLSELHGLFERGIGVVLRHPQQHSTRLARLSEALARDVPGEQRVLVFATPKGTHGFGWHYDAEEVFIVQTAGEKEYFFRKNTIDTNPQKGAQPDFSRIREETTPLMSCRLIAGDFLYLPRGYWHMAQPLADSLSISIGIFPDAQAQA